MNTSNSPMGKVCKCGHLERDHFPNKKYSGRARLVCWYCGFDSDKCYSFSPAEEKPSTPSKEIEQEEIEQGTSAGEEVKTEIAKCSICKQKFEREVNRPGGKLISCPEHSFGEAETQSPADWEKEFDDVKIPTWTEKGEYKHDKTHLKAFIAEAIEKARDDAQEDLIKNSGMIEGVKEHAIQSERSRIRAAVEEMRKNKYETKEENKGYQRFAINLLALLNESEA